jgi:hypothetical protein
MEASLLVHNFSTTALHPRPSAAARAAVSRGDVKNVSAWVNEGMRRQLDHERRLGAADDYFARYEAEHGEITQEEMDEAERVMAERSIHVRGRGSFARIFGNEYHAKNRDDT